MSEKHIKTINLKQGEAYYDAVSDISIGIHRIEYVNEIAKAVVNIPSSSERKNLDVEIKVGSLWKYESKGKTYILLVAGFKGSGKDDQNPFFIIEIREVD